MEGCDSPHLQSQVSCSFSLIEGNRISVSLAKGNPKQIVQELSADGSSLEVSVLEACDRMVGSLLGSPGFFQVNSVFFQMCLESGNLYLQCPHDLGKTPDLLRKNNFNPSWDNAGNGIFFTSNRKVFNNVYHLDLATRKVSTIANYREATSVPYKSAILSSRSYSFDHRKSRSLAGYQSAGQTSATHS